MTTGQPFFGLDVLNSSGQVAGPGPIYNVISITIMYELSRTPEITVVVPANDERVINHLTSTGYFRVRTRDGVVARFQVSEIALSTQLNQPTYTVTGLGLMDELRRASVFNGSVFDNKDLRTEIIGQDSSQGTLLRSTGWDRGSVWDYGDTTIEFEGQSVLSAIIALAEQVGAQIRQGSTERTLDFGTFGSDSDVRITNVAHALKEQFADPSGSSSSDDVKIAFISETGIAEIGGDIENTIIPLGKDRFTIADASGTITDILVWSNVRSPLGFATTTDDATSGATIPCTDTSGFVVGEEIWIGTWNDWTADHETGEIDSISAGVSITLTSNLTNSYGAGVRVFQRPIFAVQDSTSLANYGARQNTWSAAWIGPVDSSDSASQTQAADVLYAAAKARLERYKDPYKRYQFPVVYGFPVADVKVGDKVHVVYYGSLSYLPSTVPTGVGTEKFGRGSYTSINDDMYVTRMEHTWQANGVQSSMIEVSNVNRPTPANEDIILYNLDTLRWMML